MKHFRIAAVAGLLLFGGGCAQLSAFLQHATAALQATITKVRSDIVMAGNNVPTICTLIDVLDTGFLTYSAIAKVSSTDFNNEQNFVKQAHLPENCPRDATTGLYVAPADPAAAIKSLGGIYKAMSDLVGKYVK